MKKIVWFLLVIMVPGIMIAIEKKDYSFMTEHDRVILALSYYEVALKYQESGKKDLAKGYLQEAYQIEPEVEEYYNGKMQLPEKTVQFDWDSIFSEDEIENEGISVTDMEENEKSFEPSDLNGREENTNITEENPKAEDKVALEKTEDKADDEVTDIDERVKNGTFIVWESFVSALHEVNFEEMEACFAETIIIPESNLILNKEELMDTVENWFELGNVEMPEYTWESSGMDQIKVELSNLNEAEEFFFPNEKGVFWVHTATKEGREMIDCISSAPLPVSSVPSK